MAVESYQRSISQGLDTALERTTKTTWDLAETRVILFSDLHRGQHDHADDFRKSESSYRKALKYYFENDFTLIVVGDSEELWECRPGKVIPAYRDSLNDESRFWRDPQQRYCRIWGNHDDLWRFPKAVSRHLAPIFGALPFREGLDVEVTDGPATLGRLFVVHGHQGTPGSDRWGRLSRHLVRWFWRPMQRLFKISLTTPADNFEVRSKHDRAMYDWAAERGDLVLIAGHTHRPVFVSKPHVETIERLYRHVLESPRETFTPDQTAEKDRADQELAWARSESAEGVREIAGAGRDRWCYFNIGCGSFSNGDVTGIEVADREIRLVRWSIDEDDPGVRIVERQYLKDVFSQLGT